MRHKHGSYWQQLFWSKIKKTKTCWLWTASKDTDGYGQTGISNPFYRKAHRASWLLNCGEIPKNMCVLHRCDKRDCVNPQHLFLGTHADNVHDCIRKGRARRGIQCGEEHGKAKLTVEEVLEIRKGDYSQTVLALKFGVSRSAIKHVQHGRSWAWL